MDGFVRGEIDVLVATTVFEVGADVPNASLMVIEHAGRFTSRSCTSAWARRPRRSDESVCVLLSRADVVAREARLKVIYENNDGFEFPAGFVVRAGQFLGARRVRVRC